MQTPLNFIVAFVIVLALIGGTMWLIRRFAGSRLGPNANRGRMPRLAVIDAAAVDGRRRLVLVRRDNVEHLLMIGGPTDIVVEPNIVRAQPAREQIPPRVAVPSPEASWHEPEFARSETFELNEPVSAPEPPRPPRTAFPDEPRRPAPPRPPESRPRPSDPFGNIAAELSTRTEPTRETPRMPRSEPLTPRPARPTPVAEPPPLKPPPVRAPERAQERPQERAAERPQERTQERAQDRPQAPATADQNLAEMAQRLEAALRRPAGEQKADGADRAPSVAPDTPRAPRTTPPDLPASASAPAANDSQAGTPKAPFRNLEEEMASLLGRPKTPS
jgi:flagellar protein FliO/FliZ